MKAKAESPSSCWNGIAEEPRSGCTVSKYKYWWRTSRGTCHISAEGSGERRKGSRPSRLPYVTEQTLSSNRARPCDPHRERAASGVLRKLPSPPSASRFRVLVSSGTRHVHSESVTPTGRLAAYWWHGSGGLFACNQSNEPRWAGPGDVFLPSLGVPGDWALAKLTWA